MLRRVLAGSRYVVLLAVVGSFAAAVALIAYGAVAVAFEIVAAVRAGGPSGTGAKLLATQFIELTDVFLLGTVLYIVALGLYELFIDDELPLPSWLRIETLDDLKDKLIGVVVVLLGVTFLGDAVTWEPGSGPGILYLGGAIALVIAALTAALRFRAGKHGGSNDG